MSDRSQIDVFEAIAGFASALQERPCPWCSARQWDQGSPVMAPIVPVGAPFHAEAPFVYNPMLILFVFTCQACRYTVSFSPGGLLAPKARSAESTSA